MIRLGRMGIAPTSPPMQRRRPSSRPPAGRRRIRTGWTKIETEWHAEGFLSDLAISVEFECCLEDSARISRLILRVILCIIIHKADMGDRRSPGTKPLWRAAKSQSGAKSG